MRAYRIGEDVICTGCASDLGIRPGRHGARIAPVHSGEMCDACGFVFDSYAGAARMTGEGLAAIFESRA